MRFASFPSTSSYISCFKSVAERDGDRLAGDEPALVSLLAQARLSTRLPAAVQVHSLGDAAATARRDPRRGRRRRPTAPSSSGRRRPARGRRRAGRRARRAAVPARGQPLEALVTRGGRATIVVEPPALPLPGAPPTRGRTRSPPPSPSWSGSASRRERQTLLVASGLTRRPDRRELESLGRRRGSPPVPRQRGGARRRGPRTSSSWTCPGPVPLRVNRALVETDLVADRDRRRDGAARRAGGTAQGVRAGVAARGRARTRCSRPAASQGWRLARAARAALRPRCR